MDFSYAKKAFMKSLCNAKGYRPGKLINEFLHKEDKPQYSSFNTQNCVQDWHISYEVCQTNKDPGCVICLATLLIVNSTGKSGLTLDMR